MGKKERVSNPIKIPMTMYTEYFESMFRKVTKKLL